MIILRFHQLIVYTIHIIKINFAAKRPGARIKGIFSVIFPYTKNNGLNEFKGEFKMRKIIFSLVITIIALIVTATAGLACTSFAEFSDNGKEIYLASELVAYKPSLEDTAGLAEDTQPQTEAAGSVTGQNESADGLQAQTQEEDRRKGNNLVVSLLLVALVLAALSVLPIVMVSRAMRHKESKKTY